MSTSILTPARAAYYDRNAISISGTYFATIAPHAQTTRVTYTVPAGRIAIIESANCHILRVTAATTAVYCSTFTGTSTIRAMEQLVTSNAVNYYDRDKAHTHVTLYEGTTYYGVTSDNSTGGTVEYLLQFCGTEFDV